MRVQFSPCPPSTKNSLDIVKRHPLEDGGDAGYTEMHLRQANTFRGLVADARFFDHFNLRALTLGCPEMISLAVGHTAVWMRMRGTGDLT